MFTEVEVRSTIRILTTRGKMGKEILQEVNALYGVGCRRKTCVYEWRNMFLHGRTNLADEERSVLRTSTLVNIANGSSILTAAYFSSPLLRKVAIKGAKITEN